MADVNVAAATRAEAEVLVLVGTAGRPLRHFDMPVSESGDCWLGLTHYFDERGRTASSPATSGISSRSKDAATALPTTGVARCTARIFGSSPRLVVKPLFPPKRLSHARK